QLPAVDVAGGEHRQRAVTVLLRHDGHHADTHVEGLLHLLTWHTAQGGDGAEDLPRGPGGTRHLRDQALRDHAGHVAGQSTTGDVAEHVHLALGDERQAVLGVDACRLEQFLTEGASEILDVGIHGQPRGVEEDVAGQGVAVGVQAGGGHADDDITATHTLRSEQLTSSDHSDGGGGDIVVAYFHDTRVLA